MTGTLNFKEIRELFRSEKSIKIILIAGAAIILIIALSGLSSDSTTADEDSLFDYSRQSEYEKALEEKLGGILAEIDGIGNIKIMITLDSSEQSMFESGENEPVCVKTPSVRGVIVVCDGGDNILIKEKVISAVSGAFGISTTHISVIK